LQSVESKIKIADRFNAAAPVAKNYLVEEYTFSFLWSAGIAAKL
jgi:hypothetical protein